MSCPAQGQELDPAACIDSCSTEDCKMGCLGYITADAYCLDLCLWYGISLERCQSFCMPQKTTVRITPTPSGDVMTLQTPYYTQTWGPIESCSDSCIGTLGYTEACTRKCQIGLPGSISALTPTSPSGRSIMVWLLFTLTVIGIIAVFIFSFTNLHYVFGNRKASRRKESGPDREGRQGKGPHRKEGGRKAQDRRRR